MSDQPKTESRCYDCGRPQVGHPNDHQFVTLCTAGGLSLPCTPLEPDECVACGGSSHDSRYAQGRDDWDYCRKCNGTGKKSGLGPRKPG